MRTIETSSGSKFRVFSGGADLEAARDDELPPLYRGAVEAGWIETGGAWFLKKFRDEYYGSESQFTDRTGYEAAVNGRSIPDDEQPQVAESARYLATRGITFARRALEALPGEAPPVTAYISVSRAVYDESVFEGSVTFCADHDGESPYATDLDGFLAGVAAIRSIPHPAG